MIPQARGSRGARDRKSLLPRTVTDRTDRLVELADHCAAAKEIAERLGEDFLAYLLSMAGQESAAAMRRATAGAPPPAKVRRRAKPAS